MKFFFNCLVLGMLFSSCNTQDKSKIIKLEKTKEEIALDSIVKQEELIVIGNIRFGISQEEFEKDKKEFEEKTKGRMRRNYIGDYNFFRINGYFYNDKLYYVEVVGHPIGYKSYDKSYVTSMPAQSEAIINIFKIKYGNPFVENKLPSWRLISEGEQYVLTEWMIGDKKINIIVQCKGGDYRLNIIIYKPSITEIVNEEKQAKERDRKQDAIKKGVEVL